jgi:hypothetical protein
MQTYPDFLDSTGLLGDGPGLRGRLDRDGYLFIRELLPAPTVLSVRERLLGKAAAGGWLDPDSAVRAGIANPAAACKDPEDRYMRVFRSLWMDEELHRLRTHSIVIDLFPRIFGEPALAHPMFVQRNIFHRGVSSLLCARGDISILRRHHRHAGLRDFRGAPAAGAEQRTGRASNPARRFHRGV